MRLVIDSFWRAAAYCLLPKVLLWSLLPLLAIGAVAFGLGFAWWSDAADGVVALLRSVRWLAFVWERLDAAWAARLQSWLGPLLLVLLAVPATVIACLLMVAVFMTPALSRLVARRRFPGLVKRGEDSVLASLGWSLGSTALALLALLLSVPFWLIPPLVFILPPLIWGWLTYRVMAYDALATHADAVERRILMRRHRANLLLIGIACGYLGAAPSIVWASGLLFAAAFPVLIPVALWIYTMVFTLSSLWFLHYGLAALEDLRAGQGAAADASMRPPEDARIQR